MAPGPFEARLQELTKSVEAEVEAGLAQSRTACRMTELIRKADLIADEQIAQVHARISQAAAQGNRKDFDCKPGCAWCCHRTVYATIPEALTIHAYVDEHFSDDEKQSLSERVEQYVQAVPVGADLSRSRV